MVVVPVYRNAPTLEELARRPLAALEPTGLSHRLLFVVDASPNDAWAVFSRLAGQDPRIGGLLLPSNQGQHSTLLTGIAHTRARWVAVMDADLQDPPELLPKLMSTYLSFLEPQPYQIPVKSEKLKIGHDLTFPLSFNRRKGNEQKGDYS